MYTKDETLQILSAYKRAIRNAVPKDAHEIYQKALLFIYKFMDEDDVMNQVEQLDSYYNYWTEVIV